MTLQLYACNHLGFLGFGVGDFGVWGCLGLFGVPWLCTFWVQVVLVVIFHGFRWVWSCLLGW